MDKWSSGSVSTLFWIIKATFGRKHIYSTLARLSSVSIPQNIPMETQEFTFGISVAVIRSLMFSNRPWLQNIWCRTYRDRKLSPILHSALKKHELHLFVCLILKQRKRVGVGQIILTLALLPELNDACVAYAWHLVTECSNKKNNMAGIIPPSLTLISMLLVRFNFRLQA
jgi:hypothetical protein